jgi:trimethylguanosine synthase
VADMTLICHRVDLFDDFVPGASVAVDDVDDDEETMTSLPPSSTTTGGGGISGGVAVRCLGLDGGCACRAAPCSFCHTVMMDDDVDHVDRVDDDIHNRLERGRGGGIHPNLALLFGGGFGMTTTSSSNGAQGEREEGGEKRPSGGGLKNARRSMIIDPIFARNHGLLVVEGEHQTTTTTMRYRPPPAGQYGYSPPLMALPEFFVDDGRRDPRPPPPIPSPFPPPVPSTVPLPLPQVTTNVARCADNCYGGNAGRTEQEEEEEEEEEEEDGNAGLESFFDDFKLASSAPPADAIRGPPPSLSTRPPVEDDGRIAVLRSPLKTVVTKDTTLDDGDCHPDAASYRRTNICPCERRRQRDASSTATRPPRWRKNEPNPHDPSVVQDKYWAQRRRLFSRFDDGILLDPEGWFSVTPEVVAAHVASRFADFSYRSTSRRRDGYNYDDDDEDDHAKREPMVVLDAFCGCGGNAIAFARLPPSAVSLVVCVDIDRSKLRMAARNASIYNVSPDRIVFVEANSVALMERCYRDGTLIAELPPPGGSSARHLPRETCDGFAIGGTDILVDRARRIDAVFMDPPWGGVDYGASGRDGYDLSRDMRIRGCEVGCVGFPPTPEVDGLQLLRIAAAAVRTRFVAYDLPRNANKRSVARAALEAGYEGNCKLEEHYLNGRLKTVTGYFGQDFRYLLDFNKYQEGVGTHEDQSDGGMMNNGN